MKKLFIWPVVGLVALCVAASIEVTKLKINGKAVGGKPLMINDRLYVPVSALKSAGMTASIDGDTLSLSTSAAGGANQQAGVEGGLGDWLFNGIWRFRVISVDKVEGDVSGWKAAVEIRNGSKFDGYSPGGTGWQGVTLVLEDGTSVPARSDAPDFRDLGLNQGAGNAQTLYFDTDSSSKPDRLILRFDPKGLEGTPLKFSVKDPTFRVSLKKPE